jgi:hypothetical protein
MAKSKESINENLSAAACQRRQSCENCNNDNLKAWRWHGVAWRKKYPAAAAKIMAKIISLAWRNGCQSSAGARFQALAAWRNA